MSSNKPSVEDKVSPESIMEIATSFYRSRVLLTAYELDLFTALGDESRSANDVAKEIGTDEGATERLMNALCALKLLEKREGKFSNTAQSSFFLVRGKKSYIAAIKHFAHLWDNWSALTQVLRSGKSVAAGHLNDRGEKWLTAFISAMHERAGMQAQGVVQQIDLDNVSRVLDVGGGSGAYSMAFVKAGEGISAAVFDLPNVVPLTRKFIEAEGLSSRVETVIGDINIDELGSGFDIVFLSALIHSNSYSENRKLIEKCYRALNPGGRVIVQDFIMDEDRTSPAFGALFSLNMLVGTESGDTYTESEVRSWMEDVGLGEIIRKDTGFGTTLITGRKMAE